MRSTAFAIPLLLVLASTSPAHGAADASSEYRSRRDPADWSASSAVDSDLQTAWMNGDGTDGVGSWLRIDLPRGSFRGLQIATGAAQRGKYGRAKEISLEVRTASAGGVPSEPIKQWAATLKDEAGFQDVTLEEAMDLSSSLFGGSVTLTIKSVYPGEDFEECATAEIKAVYEEVKAPTTLVSASSGKGARLVDESTKSAWVGEGNEGETVAVEAAGWIASSVGVVPGNAAAWSSYARVKEAELSIGGQTWTHTFQDKNSMQWVPLPGVAGVSAWPYGSVSIKVLSVYPGKRAQVSISEIRLRALAFEG